MFCTEEFAARVRADMVTRQQPHCVYRAYDEHDLLLYVGCSRVPEKRIQQHRYTSKWFPRMARLVEEWHPTFHIARAVERAAIDTEQPEFNVSPAEHARRILATKRQRGQVAA